MSDRTLLSIAAVVWIAAAVYLAGTAMGVW